MVCSWEICVCSGVRAAGSSRLPNQQKHWIFCDVHPTDGSLFNLSCSSISLFLPPAARSSLRWTMSANWGPSTRSAWPLRWLLTPWVMSGRWVSSCPTCVHTHTPSSPLVSMFTYLLSVSAEHCLKECRSFSAWTSSLFLGLLIAVNNNGIVFVEKIELCVWVFLMAHQ